MSLPRAHCLAPPAARGEGAGHAFAEAGETGTPRPPGVPARPVLTSPCERRGCAQAGLFLHDRSSRTLRHVVVFVDAGRVQDIHYAIVVLER